MANKRFLEKIKNQTCEDDESNIEEVNYEDEELDLGSLGQEIFKNEEKPQNKKDIFKEIEKNLEDDFGGLGESKPLDLSNLPKISSLDIKDEEDEEEEEITISTRKRGRPKVVENEPVENEEIKNKPIENEVVENEVIFNKTEIKNDDIKLPLISDNNVVSNKILNYVCIKTINNLLDSYKSKMYTEEYTKKLFNQYINCEIDSSNPLFKELITECIENNVVDEYLNDLTIDVLNYIKERNV